MILLNAFGNLSLTVGMRGISTQVSVNPLDYIKAMFHPLVAFGIVLLILWLLTRMALLSRADLSFVLPVTGAGYVLAALLGHFFLNETVHLQNWLGVFLIFFGTACVGATKPRTS